AAVRRAADARGIEIMGDVPIYVAWDSADVWANRHLFQLDENGVPSVVAGVPPDYFSETGQRWGNPLYRWDALRETRYRWWVSRIRAALRFADVVRVDHFRGFAAYWEIPASETTAIHGRWVPGPGPLPRPRAHRRRRVGADPRRLHLGRRDRDRAGAGHPRPRLRGKDEHARSGEGQLVVAAAGGGADRGARGAGAEFGKGQRKR